MNILIYIIGTRQHGMGHVQRQLVLAGELAKRGHKVDFLTFSDTPGLKRIGDWIGFGGIDTSKRDMELMAVPNAGVLAQYITKHQCDITIIDIEHGPSRLLLEHAKCNNRKVIVIDGVGFVTKDQQAIDDLVDLQVYQSVALNTDSKPLSKHLIGLEYVIIDQSYTDYRNGKLPFIDNTGTLISMGGADPHGMSVEIADIINSDPRNQPVKVVLGPAAYGPAACSYKLDGFNIYTGHSTLAPLMASSTTLITALGMTVYEALCVGIPVACTAWSEDHESTALKLEAMGAICYLGQWHKIDWGKLTTFLNTMNHEHNRQAMGNIGMRLVDGLGVKRVADAIEAL